MNENYSQSVEVDVPSKARKMQWLGIACILLGAGFVMLAIFHSLYWLIAVAAFVAFGATYIHFYNDTATEYFYSVSHERLVVAKKDVVNRTRRILSVAFEDALRLEPMEDLLDDSDILAASGANDSGVYQLLFNEDGKARRLLFAPDEYMIALIEERLKEIAEEKQVEEGAENDETIGEIGEIIEEDIDGADGDGAEAAVEARSDGQATDQIQPARQAQTDED